MYGLWVGPYSILSALRQSAMESGAHAKVALKSALGARSGCTQSALSLDALRVQWRAALGLHSECTLDALRAHSRERAQSAL